MAIATGTAILAGTLGAAALSSRSASKAASTQAAAAEQSGDQQRAMFERQVELSEPWRVAGEIGLNRLVPLATEYKPFGMDEFRADPGYGFRLAEGQKALERSAAARGGLLSGATGKALTRYGQEMGSQEYTNAFNRYQAERQARLNPLQSLAGMGQTAAQQIGQAGMLAAQNIGDTQMSAAAARASGYVGSTNALNQALGTYMNYTQGQNMINALRPQNPSAPIVGY